MYIEEKNYYWFHSLHPSTPPPLSDDRYNKKVPFFEAYIFEVPFLRPSAKKSLISLMISTRLNPFSPIMTLRVVENF